MLPKIQNCPPISNLDGMNKSKPIHLYMIRKLEEGWVNLQLYRLEAYEGAASVKMEADSAESLGAKPPLLLSAGQ